MRRVARPLRVHGGAGRGHSHCGAEQEGEGPPVRRGAEEGEARGGTMKRAEAPLDDGAAAGGGDGGEGEEQQGGGRTKDVEQILLGEGGLTEVGRTGIPGAAAAEAERAGRRQRAQRHLGGVDEGGLGWGGDGASPADVESRARSVPVASR